MPELLKGKYTPVVRRVNDTTLSIMDNYAANAAAVKQQESREQRVREIRKWKPIICRIAVIAACAAALAAAWFV